MRLAVFDEAIAAHSCCSLHPTRAPKRVVLYRDALVRPCKTFSRTDTFVQLDSTGRNAPRQRVSYRDAPGNYGMLIITFRTMRTIAFVPILTAYAVCLRWGFASEGRKMRYEIAANCRCVPSNLAL